MAGWSRCGRAMAAAARESADVCVIGSGISGLTAAKELKKAGLSVVVLEKASRLGGIWAGRGTYECLRLQQHKRAFGLEGCPWPEGAGAYPTASEVRALVNEFADVHGLRDLVRLRSPATAARYDPERGVWATTYGASRTPTIEEPASSRAARPVTAPQVAEPAERVCESRFVAFAGGALGEPSVPDSLKAALEGFEGSTTHSTGYYRPLGYAGRRVVVVGFGASSVEIAADLAYRGDCASVTLLAPPRVAADGTPYEDWCLSRDLDDRAARFFCADPREPQVSVAARNAAVRAAMATRHPRVAEALPAALRPKGEPLDGRIVVSEAFNDAVAQGRIRVVAGGVARATAASILVDNEARDELEADDLILCTGYAPPLPRLRLLAEPAPNSTELYQTMWSPDVPNAAFLGLGYGFVAITQLVDVQARLLAAVASDRLALPTPDEMRDWIASRGPTNLLATTQCLTDNAYFAEIAAPLADLPPPPLAAPRDRLVVPVLGTRARASSRAFSSSSAPNDDDAAREFKDEEGPAAAAAMSAAGDEITGTDFKSDDPCATYSKWAATYDDDSFDVLKFDSPYACRDHVLAYWPRADRVQILDVGCGTGAIARLLSDALDDAARANVDFHGLDLTPEMLAVAKRHGYYDTLRQWSVSDTPWPVDDDSKDLAACNGVLIYVAPDPAVLAEFVRVVKPAGHVVLMFRDDNVADWQPHIDALERDRKWKLVEVSDSRDNFPGSPAADARITYRIYVFEVLLERPTF
mmetsp:Transcript_8723/g.27423  ORF Transcript_8723/g.27423 Transcript_8723/m.27423 type:complete len:756 (-) Transcript_8723:508-2775(-)